DLSVDGLPGGGRSGLDVVAEDRRDLGQVAGGLDADAGYAAGVVEDVALDPPQQTQHPALVGAEGQRPQVPVHRVEPEDVLGLREVDGIPEAGERLAGAVSETV